MHSFDVCIYWPHVVASIVGGICKLYLWHSISLHLVNSVVLAVVGCWVCAVFSITYVCIAAVTHWQPSLIVVESLVASERTCSQNSSRAAKKDPPYRTHRRGELSTEVHWSVCHSAMVQFLCLVRRAPYAWSLVIEKVVSLTPFMYKWKRLSNSGSQIETLAVFFPVISVSLTELFVCY